MRKNEFGLTPYQVAKEYWGLPLKDRTYSKVREILKIQSDNKSQQIRYDNLLSQLARTHEQRGLVKHRVLPDRTPGFADHATEYAPRLPELEDKLRRRYGLRDAIVLDTSEFRPEPSAKWQFKDDDLLHEHCGRWAGRILASVVRPADVVATGGGRGPYYSAHFCTIPPHSTFPKRVVSLTGFISAGMWRGGSDGTDDNVTRDVDADHIASLLHSKLGTTEKPGLLNCSISEKHAKPITDEVTLAVVGIGAIGGGHRLRRYEQLDDLGKARGLVRELISEITEVEKHFQSGDSFSHCVGDLCNCYFVLEGVKNAPDGKNVHKRLTALVEQINDQFVNTRPEELAEICMKGAVIAVAGGPHKIGAIAHVLKRGETGSPWITHLVTSDEVAKSILQSSE